MPAGILPGLWAMVSTVLAVFGVVYVPSDAVKAAVAAAAALIVAVWQWQHHATVRHADALAAGLARDKAAATAAIAAATHPPAPPASNALAPQTWGSSITPPSAPTV